MQQKIIWTIGHSTHSLDDFISLLSAFSISVVADVRNFPGSKRYPHFNKEALEHSLPLKTIHYIHLKELGGRRKPVAGSVNTAWKNSAFRGYADYMETPAFKHGIEQLEKLALKEPTVFMCAEAVWWSCHRSLIADYLKIREWQVLHIMNESKVVEHPYTSPARIINGELRYDEPSLF